MRRQVARKDMEERELNLGKRRLQWWSKPATVSPPGPVSSSGDDPSPKARAKERERRKEERTIHPVGAVVPPAPKSCDGPVSVGRTVSFPLPSRHPLVELLCADGAVIPSPTSPSRKPDWAVAVGVWIALSFVNEMNVCAG